MLKQVALVFSIAMLAFSSTGLMARITYDANVGPSELKNTPHAPEAIVMKDAADQDVLVVFYKESAASPVGKFVVARQAQANGALIWDSTSYSIDPAALMIENFSPAPVLMGEKLYVLGRLNKGLGDGQRKLIYNAVNNNVQDLIDNHWLSDTFFTHIQDGLATNPDPDRDEISLVNVGEDRLLMSYHAASNANNIKFSTSTCRVKNNSPYGELFCEGGEVYSDRKVDYRYPTHVNNVTYNGNTTTALFNRVNRDIALHGFNPDTLEWNNFHNANLFYLSEHPFSTVQFGDTLYLYAKDLNSPGLLESYAFTWCMACPTAFNHTYPVRPVGGDMESGYHTTKGPKALVFAGKLYIFYVDKKTGLLRYLVREA
ncbi:MAG TPA: hypothetical protein VI522_07210 [Gammaproteobacteria bacterium]|nr:hypothetical protein [Gammaproteobacteria bacterium]